MAKIIDIDDHGRPPEDIKFKLKINKDQAGNNVLQPTYGLHPEGKRC